MVSVLCPKCRRHYDDSCDSDQCDGFAGHTQKRTTPISDHKKNLRDLGIDAQREPRLRGGVLDPWDAAVRPATGAHAPAGVRVGVHARDNVKGRRVDESAITTKMMPVYISGPMSGYDDFNYPAFAAAQAWLESRGIDAMSPHEALSDKPPGSYEYADYFRADLKMLLKCKSIVMLDGFSKSKGALAEIAAADRLALPAFSMAGEWGTGYQFIAVGDNHPVHEEEDE